MLEALLPPSTERLVLYPKPVNVRWGADRLRLACESDLGLTLDPTTAVLFHNRKQDTLVLYTLDPNGDRCITKKVDRGSFLLPVRGPAEDYAVLPVSKLRSLFRA
ncbi:MAG: IS66 family insertion sequence element accessory protein TnpB [Myxococcales bacterium]|nr:IS66 family insertion sequence element accessory protein TnpB [Myxococcales bacterium]